VKEMIAGINEMKRHYANYLKGLPNIKEFRQLLVLAKTVDEIESYLTRIIETYTGFQFERRKVEMEAMAYSCG